MLDDKFNMAITKVLANEGGYVNDPKDSGGGTKYGISKRSLYCPQEVKPKK